MRLRNLILIVIILALVFGAMFFARKKERTPITDLVEQIQGQEDAVKKKSLVDQLAQMQPRKGVEFKALAGVKDAQVRQVLLESIQKSDRFRPEWVEMLDANKGDLQWMQAVLSAIARLTNKDDAPLLLDLLKNRGKSQDPTDALLTQATVAALANMKEERAIKYLLKRPDLYFGHGGGSPLAQFGSAALPQLVKIANNPHNRMAWDAGRVIAQIQDPAAVPMLMDLARTGKKDAKLGAVSALAAMKVKEAEPVFQELLKDTDFMVREEVIGALLESDFEGNFDKGVKILESDDVGAVKSAVMEEMVKHKGAMDRVEGVIEKRVEDPRGDVREESMEKLMELDYAKFGDQGLKILVQDEDWQVREKLANYFADKRDKEAVPHLEQLLTDRKDRVRFAASRALLLITKKKYRYEESSFTKDLEVFEIRHNAEYRDLVK